MKNGPHDKRMLWRCMIGVICLSGFAMLAAFPPRLAVGEIVQEDYKVKAVFIYNVMKFVEWPLNALPADTTTITVCSLGKAPLNRELESLNGRTIGKHTLALRNVNATDDLDICQVLVHGGFQVDALRYLYKKVADKPILSIGEANNFARDFGMIGFVVVNESVRLEIQSDRAKRVGIKLSAKLLEVAAIVYRENADH